MAAYVVASFLTLHPMKSAATHNSKLHSYRSSDSRMMTMTTRLTAMPPSSSSLLAAAASTIFNLSFAQSSSFKELIKTLIHGVDLSEEEAEASLDLLLNEANKALISAFLVLLRVKGEIFEDVLLLLLYVIVINLESLD
ncbi:uncharacterized protein LOC109826290 [Asparagus officinalis]|uniref:uncharacterized protein LOC109826290 n=1 Tax=Asparagus officinalis TaxID=4686 RepID=UPI00098E1295|nr:uncharacterized protein LOC109826290 [Asparagus officinalis]